MEKNLFLCSLYDYYNELLTVKQKEYFEDYYFNNLTLSEMSENYNVSRNAIHNLLKESEKKLINFEEKLKLCEKRKKLEMVLLNLNNEDMEAIKKIIDT